MRRLLTCSAAILAFAVGLARGADDAADATKVQKAAAAANWKKVFGPEAAPASAETPHLLLYGPSSMAPRQLRDLGTLLEAVYARAAKALAVESPDALWAGKLTVYLLDERRHYNSFLRTVAKQRPDPDYTGAFVLRRDQAFIVAGPPQGRQDPSTEGQAAEQLAAAMLSKVGGEAVPDWVAAGFGRASLWRAAPGAKATRQDRADLRRLLGGRRHTARDAWGPGLPANEAVLLRASLVEFLAYGPGARSFRAFLEGYLPDEGTTQEKTTEDALKAARISPDALDRSWRAWATGR